LRYFLFFLKDVCEEFMIDFLLYGARCSSPGTSFYQSLWFFSLSAFPFPSVWFPREVARFCTANVLSTTFPASAPSPDCLFVFSWLGGAEVRVFFFFRLLLPSLRREWNLSCPLGVEASSFFSAYTVKLFGFYCWELAASFFFFVAGHFCVPLRLERGFLGQIDHDCVGFWVIAQKRTFLTP